MKHQDIKRMKAGAKWCVKDSTPVLENPLVLLALIALVEKQHEALSALHAVCKLSDPPTDYECEAIEASADALAEAEKWGL